MTGWRLCELGCVPGCDCGCEPGTDVSAGAEV